MTIEYIRNAVAAILSIKGAPESAHSSEDSLYVAVLNEIACGVENPRELALEALKTQRIPFPRWCA